MGIGALYGLKEQLTSLYCARVALRWTYTATGAVLAVVLLARPLLLPLQVYILRAAPFKVRLDVVGILLGDITWLVTRKV